MLVNEVADATKGTGGGVGLTADSVHVFKCKFTDFFKDGVGNVSGSARGDECSHDMLLKILGELLSTYIYKGTALGEAVSGRCLPQRRLLVRRDGL